MIPSLQIARTTYGAFVVDIWVTTVTQAHCHGLANSRTTTTGQGLPATSKIIDLGNAHEEIHI